MLKTDVIKMRTALKAGINLPVRIMLDNCFTIIDESHKLQFTKWDDTNGILYSFRLIDLQSDKLPSNREQAISVYATTYDNIQAMELATLPLSNLNALFDSLSSSGCTMGDDFKNLIKHTFTDILHPDRYQLSPSDMNTIIGPDSVNDKDDYYDNKFTESFKETERYADRNKSINP